MINTLKPNKNDPPQNSTGQQEQDIKVIASVIGILILFGLAIVILQGVGSKTTAFLWSFASLAIGILFGFLFGIPRVLQEDKPNPSNVAGESNAAVSKENKASYRLQVNTNLEQISDWLTKIIVGIGLVELKQIPARMEALSQFVAQGLGGTANSKVFSMALLLYFAVLGFLGGYLITRIYLAGAFSRADVEAQETIPFAGRDLTIAQISKTFSLQIGDIRKQVVNLYKTLEPQAVSQTIHREQAAASPHQSISILWVDDNPDNNSVLVDQLRQPGISIVKSSSTQHALELFSKQKFDRVISDMGRKEGVRFNETAGLDLVRAIRSQGIEIPIIIYCSTQKATEYRNKAIEVGATVITSSPTVLLQSLDLGSQ